MEIKHSYAEVISDNGVRWLLNLNFLLSNYECIFGKGCKGAFHQTDSPNQGCCNVGCTLSLDEIPRVNRAVKKLGADTWQSKSKLNSKFYLTWRDGAIQTRLHTDENGNTACIFNNFDEFEGGAGCAFHITAPMHGEEWTDWKPYSCSYVPLNVAWNEHEQCGVISYVQANGGYGERSWEGLDWWCINSKEAYIGAKPTYQSMDKEIKNSVNHYDETAWDSIKEFLDLAYDKLGDKYFATPVEITMPAKETL
tara:strand:- start:566 stop:1321 length:756 start_codon:yes stop_codon:yes gene_type:complete